MDRDMPGGLAVSRVVRYVRALDAGAFWHLVLVSPGDLR
jgi:hypothetical protein